MRESLEHFELALSCLLVPVIIPMIVLSIIAGLGTLRWQVVDARRRQAERKRAENLPFIKIKTCK